MAVPLLDCEKEFDPFVTGLGLKLKATVFEVGGVAPTHIIHTDQDWYVDVEWELTGPLTHHLDGWWHLSVVLDSIGPGDDYQFPTPPARIPFDPCGNGEYKYKIEVKAGEVDARDPDGTLYTVGVTLGSEDKCKHPGQIHAHCTGDELHFVLPPG